MTVYVVRHGRAGRRHAWDGDDALRPLTEVGRRQAVALADALAEAPITRIASSPAVRCRQTVEPLALRLRIPVDLADGLAEGAPLHETLRLLEKVAGEDAVLCTHGDVLLALLGHLRAQGLAIDEGRAEPRAEKGSVWVLRTCDGEVTGATYWPAPR